MNGGGDKKVLLAMSGGVDSSVAAHLLLRQGYQVTGVFLCMAGAVGFDHDTSGCCSPQDAADARRVATALGIELFVLDAGADFTRIIDYFVDEYARGRTPNPCVQCNTLIKFARLIRRADDLGCRYVATGHYARLLEHQGGPAIHRSARKDQSYALFGLPRKHLGRILLPVGEVADKDEIRRLAAQVDPAVAAKPDSQEICFVTDDYADLLRQRRPEAFRPGNIVDAAGTVLGRHDGVGHFTIGQRRGVRVARGVPMYVIAIDPATASVTIGPKEAVMATRLTAAGANWHCPTPPAGKTFPATVQIRYNHAGEAAQVTVLEGGRFAVEFDQPVAAITPGQGAVIYEGDRLLGGGWIE